MSLSLFFHHPCNKSSHPTYVHTYSEHITRYNSTFKELVWKHQITLLFLVRCFQWILNLFPHILSTFINEHGWKNIEASLMSSLILW